MKNSDVKIYAEAFFRLCLKRKINFEDYLQIIYLLENIFQTQKKRYFYLIKTLTIYERDLFLKENFNFFLDDFWLKFLLLLNSDNRFQYLLEVLKFLKKKIEKKLQIKRGFIYSVFLLNEKDLQKITQKIAKKLNSKIILKNKIDPRLICGLRLEIDRFVFDNSFAYKISMLKKDLYKK